MGKKNKLTKSLYILKLEAYDKKKERKKSTENFVWTKEGDDWKLKWWHSEI